MRPRNGTQVGAPSSNHAVDMIGFADGPHGHRGNAGLLANAVCKWRLEHAPIGDFFLLAHLARRAIDEVGTCGLERFGDFHRIGGRNAALHPVVGRDANRQGAIRRPRLAHSRKHLQRIAQAMVQRATVVVGALVGEGADEAGQQVAVGTVQLQPIEPRLHSALGARHKFGFHAVHVGPGHGARPIAHARQVLLR